MARWKALARQHANALGFALAAATLTHAGAADAYCRSTTCDLPNSFAQCDSTPTGCQPLAWKRSCIGWTIQKDGSTKIPYEAVHAALTQAFLSWQTAGCDGGLLPGLEIQDMGNVNCAEVEYNSLGGNANIITFRDKSWPHEGADHNIALTTVTYDVNTGEIYDADIEVNTSQFDLTAPDAPVVQYDMISIFTHEAGHFLGLSHSSDPAATMYRHYDLGTTDFQTLDIDDQNAMCAVYPPAAQKVACNPIPRHGFSPDCASQQTEGKCSAPPATPSGRDDQGVFYVVVLVTGLVLRRAFASSFALRSAPHVPRAPGPKT